MGRMNEENITKSECITIKYSLKTINIKTKKKKN